MQEFKMQEFKIWEKYLTVCIFIQFLYAKACMTADFPSEPLVCSLQHLLQRIFPLAIGYPDR